MMAYVLLKSICVQHTQRRACFAKRFTTCPPQLPFPLRKATKHKANDLGHGASTDNASSHTGKTSVSKPAKAGKSQSASQATVQDSGLCPGCGRTFWIGQGSVATPTEYAVCEGEESTLIAARRVSSYCDSISTAAGLCKRCELLRQGEVSTVDDALRTVDHNAFKAYLHNVVSSLQRPLVVYVQDAADFEASQVLQLRSMIGGAVVILVVNKCDLLPRCNERDIAYMKRRANEKRANFVSMHAISAATGEGVPELAVDILSTSGGRDVVVCGAVNVGKSTVVRALVEQFTQRLQFRGVDGEKRRAALESLRVTASSFPLTTLRALRIACFPSTRHALWDTPGIGSSTSVAHALFAPHLMLPISKPNRIERRSPLFAQVGHSILVEAAWMDDPTDGLHGATDDGVEARHPVVPSARLASLVERPMCLARLDVVSIGHRECDLGDSEGADKAFDLTERLEAHYYGPAPLRLRIVRTSEAPDAAEAPQSCALNTFAQTPSLAAAYNNIKGDFLDACRRPLASYRPFAGKQVVGHPGTCLDVCFDRLGWITFYCDVDFELVPHVVKSSLVYVREPLYPRRLELSLERPAYTFHGLRATGTDKKTMSHVTSERVKSEKYFGRRALELRDEPPLRRRKHGGYDMWSEADSKDYEE